MSIESVMTSSHLILCHPLLLLPQTLPRVFSNESTLRMRWRKYWSFSFSISSSNEHPGLISFRMDWLDLLAVQGILKSPPTPHSKHQFFGAQLSSQSNSHIHRKTIALTRWTFDGKVMALLSNILSRLVIILLPRSKRLLISWLQSPSAVVATKCEIRMRCDDTMLRVQTGHLQSGLPPGILVLSLPLPQWVLPAGTSQGPLPYRILWDEGCLNRPFILRLQHRSGI